MEGAVIGDPDLTCLINFSTDGRWRIDCSNYGPTDGPTHGLTNRTLRLKQEIFDDLHSTANNYS